MKFPSLRSTRRRFVQSTFVLGAAGLWLPSRARAAAPVKNPLASLSLAWTDKLRWDTPLDITSVAGAGEFWDELLDQAQQTISAKARRRDFFPRGHLPFSPRHPAAGRRDLARRGT
jgi:hypothetical protein